MAPPVDTQINIFGTPDLSGNNYVPLSNDRPDMTRPHTAAYLHHISTVLQDEINTLPGPERAKIPAFHSLRDLIRKGRVSGMDHPAVIAAIQTAEAYARFANSFEELSEFDLVAEDRIFLGTGLGIFAATAGLMTVSPHDIIKAGSAAVKAAFRTVAWSHNIQLQQTATGTPGLRSARFASLSREEVQGLLDWYYEHDGQNVAKHNRVYISKVGGKGVIITGQSANLDAFCASAPGSSEPDETPTICLGPYYCQESTKADGEFEAALNLSTIIEDPMPSMLDNVPSQPQESDESMPFPAAILFMPNGRHCKAHLSYNQIFTEVAQQVLFDVEDEARSLHSFGYWAHICKSPRLWVQTFGPSAATQLIVGAIQPPTNAKVQTLISPREVREKVAKEQHAGVSGTEKVVISVGGDDAHDVVVARMTGQSAATSESSPVARPSLYAAADLPRHAARPKLAIVGMSGRFPDAASHQQLWKLLCQGVDTHREVPPDRFPVASHYDPSGREINTSHTPYGCWIEKPGEFDPRFFNMSPREAFQTDPMQRMAITTAYEALEMCGYVPNRTRATHLDRIGTFYGQTSDDWREVNAAQEVDTYFITGGVRAFGPGRINYHFGFSGPSFNVDTACSSSAAALHVACASLWAEECDTAIVGGLSCMTNSDIFAGLSRGQFLSKTGGCKTFDNNADGYCRADGCATIVVKRLDDALADGDNVLAVILGTLTNHSADAISITHPHGPTQSVLSRAILDQAGVDPLDIDYVEMHGTGTQAGDGTEMVSVTDVFAPRDRLRARDRPLFLGSVKANVGHGEAASGVTALCKVLMMLKHNLIPPHVGIKTTINKTFPTDLSDRNVNIAFHLTPFERHDSRPRRVFINNFSAAGGNTGLLVEDGPASAPTRQSQRGTFMVAVTAKSKASLVRNAKQLVDWIDEHDQDTPLAHLAYTTTARRIQHFWRLNVVATSMKEAARAIEKRLEQPMAPISNEPPKVAFLMTGQGSHYPQMAASLCKHFPTFDKMITDMNNLASDTLGFPKFATFLTHPSEAGVDPSPVVVQLGLCCFEIALARLWQSFGLKPAVVMGHSLGEYAALHIAGVLSLVDTIYLVGRRAQLLVEKCSPGTHAMLAVQGSVDKVSGCLGDQLMSRCSVACINGPEQTVLAGPIDDIAQASERLLAQSLKGTLLEVPFAFHSAQVDVILDEFEQVASGVEYHKPTIPISSPLFGSLVADEQINAQYLRKHAREAVNFHAALLSAMQAGVVSSSTVYLEIGPHPVCCGFAKATFGASSTLLPSLRRKEDTFKTLVGTMSAMHSAGLSLDWNEYHAGDIECVHLLDLPAYSFDNKNYWLQYDGDWLLTKNRRPIGGNTQAALPGPEAKAKPPLSTTSVHSVVSEKVDTSKGATVVTVETETNLSRPDTRPIVEGHLCNGAPLCPSTLYADMAMTIADYAYRLAKPDVAAGEIGVNVCDMNVPKTLIFDEKLPEHILRCSVVARPADNEADLIFSTTQGTRKTEHASCKVVYGDKATWADELNRNAYLVQGRIDSLLAGAQTGATNKVGRGLAYKLFSALVDYDTRYRGMDEVVFDSATCEASAKVALQPTDEDVNFVCCPFWLDSCCHISGFVINGTDSVDSREQVFVSHGWGSLRVVGTLKQSEKYRSYVRMQPLPNSKVMSGDVYVFDEAGKVVCLAGDVRFQSIPRKVLNTVLPPRGAAAAATAPAARPAAAMAKPAVASKPVTGVAAAPTAAPAAPVPTQATSSSRASGSIMEAVITILEKEIGCSRDEFADNMLFSDLGVDSLMALTVSGRMREELDVDVDSHAFIDHPTIGDFKVFLSQFEKAAPAGSNAPTVEPVSTEALPAAMAMTNPVSTSPGSTAAAAAAAVSGATGSVTAAVLAILEKEIGCSAEELADNMLFSDLGVDSLMALTVSGRMREDLELDIDSNAFIDHATIGAFKAYLRQYDAGSAGDESNTTHEATSATLPAQANSAPNSSYTAWSSENSSRVNTPPSMPSSIATTRTDSPAGVRDAMPSAALSVSSMSSCETIRHQPRARAPKVINTHPGNTTSTYPKPPRPNSVPDDYPHRKARAVLLQGSVSCSRKLWMIPDGGGSATSYTEISRLDSDWAVWGLFSPFMLTPEEYKCGVYGIATKFIEEMVRRQPEGPYSIAGWSAGGIICFEMVHQLTRAGHRVDHLILIDSPCPITIEPLPSSLHKWFASIGLIGDSDSTTSTRKVPEWLLPHFDASIKALSNYWADRIPDQLCPRIVMTIWCEKGVCSAPTDPRPNPYPDGHARFLLDDRHDFGPNRWDEYLDEDRILCRQVPGNHFSMMQGELAKMVGRHLREAILS